MVVQYSQFGDGSLLPCVTTVPMDNRYGPDVSLVFSVAVGGLGYIQYIFHGFDDLFMSPRNGITVRGGMLRQWQ